MSLTSDRQTPYRDGVLVPVPVAAGTKIFGGAQVCVNQNGMAVPGATAVNLTYAGCADAMVDNSAGIDGAVTVLVRCKGAFKWVNSLVDPVTQASQFQTVYIVDDQTVAKTNGGNTRSPGGKLLMIDSDGGVWVQ